VRNPTYYRADRPTDREGEAALCLGRSARRCSARRSRRGPMRSSRAPLFLETALSAYDRRLPVGSVDWTNEDACFRGVAEELAALHCALPVDEGNPALAADLQRGIVNVVLPEMGKGVFKPSATLATESIVVIATEVPHGSVQQAAE